MPTSSIFLRVVATTSLIAVTIFCAMAIFKWVVPQTTSPALAQVNTPQALGQMITLRSDVAATESSVIPVEPFKDALPVSTKVPLQTPQRCEHDSNQSTECKALFAMARFLGFNNTPAYLHFVTTQLNHVYGLAPLSNADSLHQHPRFIESNQQYVGGQISRSQRANTISDLIDTLMLANMEQLGAIDYVSAEYHSARLIVLINLALAKRQFVNKANGALQDKLIQNDAEYLAHQLLDPDPQFISALTGFAGALHSHRGRCFNTPSGSKPDACRHLHLVAEALGLSSPSQTASVLDALYDYLVDDIAPTSARRITFSNELEALNGYALVQRLPLTSEFGSQISQQNLLDNYVQHDRDNALQALHDANLEQLRTDGFALRIPLTRSEAQSADYAFRASTTGVFDSLIDLYRLSESLQAQDMGADTDTAPPFTFSPNRSRIDYWVGIEDEVFDLLLRIHTHSTVEREYLMIINDAGVQAWGLRPVITQIYRNSNPDDYINVAHTGYSLPRHFDHGSTKFRWLMLQAN